MAEIEDVEIKDYSKEVLNALDKTIDKALTAIGIVAVGYAAPLTPVDTGLARNSITFAIHGEKAYKEDYKANRGEGAGQYKGKAPEKKRTVYIGSNVSYFPVLEEGEGGRKGHHMLRKAITEHGDQYKKLVEKYLKETDD